MEDMDEESYVFSYWRWLAGEKVELDYTVLSVAFWTLLLLLAVELLRHFLDVAAKDRPFFKTVLEGVYRELSTLGVVELVIFHLHLYYEDFNMAIEQVFAKVHFMLFYTAIINAFQSVLVAFLSSNISNRMWVQAEEMELNHYIAIREEFARIEKKLDSRTDTQAEDYFSFKTIFKRVKRRFTHPFLMKKYYSLLITVRFHELRVHFLKTNNLPPKFKVSKYLKRSELHVFKHMVHISMNAWLALMGVVNLCYFLMGIVAYMTTDPFAVGKSLTVIFLGYCILFVLLTWALFEKMKYIFSQMMHTKYIFNQSMHGNSHHESNHLELDSVHDVPPTVQGMKVKSSSGVCEIEGKKQMDLFWIGDPHFVISLIQFMQFGYAIAIAVMLLFWPSINVYYAPVKFGWMVFTLVMCYVIFVYTVAELIPRYTLCTSLGQLVNQRRLNETLAQFRLDEAVKKRRYRQEEKQSEEALAKEVAKRETRDSIKESKEKVKQKENESKAENVLKKAASTSKIDRTKRKLSRDAEGAESDSEESQDSMRMKTLTEMVLKDTKDLLKLAPAPARSIRDRRNERKRAVSDGVAAMRAMTPTLPFFDSSATSSFDEDKPSIPKDDQAIQTKKRDKRRRKKSVSAGVALMQNPVSSMFNNPDKNKSEQKENVELSATRSTTRRDSLKRRSSLSSLQPLVEGIPAMTVDATELSVPLGRKSFKLEPIESESKINEISEDPLVSSTIESESQVETVIKTDHQNKAVEEVTNATTGRSTIESESQVETLNETDYQNKTIEEVTNATIESDEDNESDDEDMPDVEMKYIVKRNSSTPSLSLCQKLLSFIPSHNFRTLDFAFGTMPCFFYIGMRIEDILVVDNDLEENEGTPVLSLKYAFILEAVWLGLFILESIIFIILFSSFKSPKSPEMVIAAISDFILSGICLGLLLGAEMQRCCDKPFGENSGLGKIEPCTSLIILRMLRFVWAKKLVSWWKKYVKGIEQQNRRPPRNISSNSIMYYTNESTVSIIPGDYDNPKKDHDHDHHSMSAERGTVLESWRNVVSLHPEIVSKYGEFSGEILQKMLGINIVEDKSNQKTQQESPMSSNDGNSDEGVTSEVKESAANGRATYQGGRDPGDYSTSGFTTPDRSRSPIPKRKLHSRYPSQEELEDYSAMKVQNRFSHVSDECRQVILAGKLGRSLKHLNSLTSDDGFSASGQSASTFQSLWSPDRNQKSEQDFESPKAKNVQFKSDQKEIDVDSQDGNMKENELNDPTSAFLFPNARLIRRMRRCERKLPPFLNHWALVDVVLTKYEIVYFDATEFDEHDGSNRSIQNESHHLVNAESKKQRDAAQEALIATKGGKGLRLCDVAVGRKVVGHIDLADINMIKVERLLPHSMYEGSGAVDQDMQGNELNGEQKSPVKSSESQHLCGAISEYWKPKTACLSCSQEYDVTRWERVEEDRLKVTSTQGTLFMRFLSDLEDAENKEGETPQTPEEALENFDKSDALLWCQTIVRLVGPEQLTQKLPHFGDLGRDELRDYLEVTVRSGHEESNTKTRFNKINTMRSLLGKHGISKSITVSKQTTTIVKFADDPNPIEEHVTKVVELTPRGESMEIVLKNAEESTEMEKFGNEDAFVRVVTDSDEIV